MLKQKPQASDRLTGSDEAAFQQIPEETDFDRRPRHERVIDIKKSAGEFGVGSHVRCVFGGSHQSSAAYRVGYPSH